MSFYSEIISRNIEIICQIGLLCVSVNGHILENVWSIMCWLWLWSFWWNIAAGPGIFVTAPASQPKPQLSLVVVLPINSGREISCLISSIICPPARAGLDLVTASYHTFTTQTPSSNIFTTSPPPSFTGSNIPSHGRSKKLWKLSSIKQDHCRPSLPSLLLGVRSDWRHQ